MKKSILLLFYFTMSLNLFSQNDSIISRLEIFDLKKQTRKPVLQENNHFEAPNWSRDGKFLVYNSRGKLYRFDLDSGKSSLINTGFADQLNNDHGISPDGKRFVISHAGLPDQQSETTWLDSRIYTLPISGGKPQLVTEKAPSFWHGWSPDGDTLAYVARRNDEFDIYKIHVDGGEEIRLTTEKGLDDGPDYSADGKYIYYNSFQSGSMEIWRMDSNGENKTQITNDEYSNWFPHPSPDGKHLVFISYLEDQGEAHPAMKKVAVRLLNLSTGKVEKLFKFTGGQGSLNVPSWSPDGSKFAFVSYEYAKN